MVKTKLSIPPLDYFHSSFIRTASIIKTENPITIIEYLDMVYTPSEQIEKKPFSKDDLIFPGALKTNETVGVKAFSTAISLSTKQVTTSIGKSQLIELDAMGINAAEMAISAMCNEKIHGMEKELYEKYTKIAGNVDSVMKPRQKFFKKIFKNLKFPIYVESNRQLISKILGYANLISIRHRRGPGNFVVVGPKLASMIQDSPGFVTFPLGQERNTLVNAIGSLAGLTIYTNSSLRWDDTSLLVGRTTSKTETGVYLLEMDDRVEEVMMHPANSDVKIGLYSRQAIADTMNVQDKYIYVKLELNKAPWWRRWMKLT
jgi:hypothetical protein